MYNNYPYYNQVPRFQGNVDPMQYQQPHPIIKGLQGKSVDSIDVVRATDVPKIIAKIIFLLIIDHSS